MMIAEPDGTSAWSLRSLTLWFWARRAAAACPGFAGRPERPHRGGTSRCFGPPSRRGVRNMLIPPARANARNESANKAICRERWRLARPEGELVVAAAFRPW